MTVLRFSAISEKTLGPIVISKTRICIHTKKGVKQNDSKHRESVLFIFLCAGRQTGADIISLNNISHCAASQINTALLRRRCYKAPLNSYGGSHSSGRTLLKADLSADV